MFGSCVTVSIAVRQFRRFLLIVLALGVSLLLIGTPTPVRALTYTVTNTNDSGAGSLRAAVAATNGTPGVADTITFAVTGTITLTSGVIEITDSLTITGPGAGLLTISGNNASRVFLIYPSHTVSVSGLTIANGDTTDTGGGTGIFNNFSTLTVTNSIIRDNLKGGINNQGTLTVTNSTFSGNLAFGAIGSQGTMTITNSTFSSNSSIVGGAIGNSGTATVTNSTFSGNSATVGSGGAIHNYVNGELTIINSTFTGNSASTFGGAIYDEETLTIINSTISGNSAADGGGVYSIRLAKIKNSIIAGNTAPTNPNYYAPFTTFSGVNLTGGDPGLLPLANNGGPTQTRALTAASPARDAATDCTDVDGNPITTDQRGTSRPLGTACDVGAFEAVALTTTINSITRAVGSTNPTNAASVQFTVTFASAVTGLSASNFTLNAPGITGATVGTITGGSTTYTVTVNTGTGSGTLRLDLTNTSGITPAPSNAPFTTGEAFTIDKTPPTVTISPAAGQSNPTANAPILFDLVLSETPIGFDGADVSVTNGTLALLGGSGTTYTVEVIPTTAGDVSISVAAGAFTDAVGNPNTASTGTNTVTFNPALVTATITRTDPNPTAADSVRFTVTFSEDVNGVDATDFEVITNSTLTGVSAPTLTGSGASYTVTVGTGTGDGTLRLNLNDDDSIVTISFSVPLGGVGADNGDVTGPEYTIVRTVLVVFPTPQPVPLCALMGGGTNSIVRADVPGGLNTDVFCRVLNENGVYVRDAAEVGDATLINAGTLQAVDVFGFSAGGVQVAAFNQPIRVCLQGAGRLFFRDATNAPRVTVPLAGTSEGGYTCASIPNAGTVVLVR
jgi:predicted outer membrane repeat protein